MSEVLEYPPRQKLASFHLNTAINKLQQATDGGLRFHQAHRLSVHKQLQATGPAGCSSESGR